MNNIPQRELRLRRAQTLKELSQLYFLKKEIADDEKRLEKLNKEKPVPGQNLTGMPGGGNSQNYMDKYLEDIEDLEAIISAKRIQCIHERNRIERFIADIPDSRTRLIFTYRFVDCLSWDGCAAKMGEGYNTGKNLSNICYRYIDKINKSKS